MRESFGDKVFTTVIRRSVRYPESAERGVSILDYRPELGADYIALADELLARLGDEESRERLRALRAGDASRRCRPRSSRATDADGRERYDVRDKVVLITGAARGIGAEAARRLAKRGAQVSLVGLEPELLEQVAAEIGAERGLVRGRRDRLGRARAARSTRRSSASAASTS